MNTEQRDAVEFKDGTLLLLAGPGSGKTFVITNRIIELINSGVDPKHILVITFTKAAAISMKNRFEMLLEVGYNPPVTFGTFHSIFFHILKSHRAYRNVVPVTDKEKLNMITRASEIAGVSSLCADFEDKIRLLSLISACKNNGNDPNDFGQEELEKSQFVTLFNAYNGLLAEFDRIDFDDMINKCIELLKSDNKVLSYWQSRFDYILIDEFQDISGNQYELVKLLAFPQYNIFAVGDDDQSIYRFRGARVEIMKQLLDDIPCAQKKYLSINYRSTEGIVDASCRIIENNKDRFPKNIISAQAKGNPVNVSSFGTRSEETLNILDIIKRKEKEGVLLNDIAILTRTNRQGANYAALLRREHIPVVFKEQMRPYSSIYFKDLCAYMSYASGNCSRENFLHIMNRPLRYIKRDACQNKTVSISDLYKYYADDKNMIIRIREMEDGLKRIKNMRPYLAVNYIRNTMGYDSYVRGSVSSEKYAQYIEEMKSFLLLIKPLGSIEEVYSLLDEIWNSVTCTDEQCGVQIMTFHGSKGLEFDTVILPDINEGVVPPKSAHTDIEIEEERRMFYVAMTRAKNTLCIQFVTEENRRPSRFIKEDVRGAHHLS